MSLTFCKETQPDGSEAWVVKGGFRKVALASELDCVNLEMMVRAEVRAAREEVRRTIRDAIGALAVTTVEMD